MADRFQCDGADVQAFAVDLDASKLIPLVTTFHPWCPKGVACNICDQWLDADRPRAAAEEIEPA